jgi:nucleotide-binding universal stress UspA family protein
VGARLVLLAAHDQMEIVTTAPTAEFADETESPIGRELNEAARSATVPAEPRLLVGEPGTVIPHETREGIDVLVTGSRGYGPVKSVLLGSVSRQLVDHATCPVIVVPRSAPAVDVPPEEAGSERSATPR